MGPPSVCAHRNRVDTDPACQGAPAPETRAFHAAVDEHIQEVPDGDGAYEEPQHDAEDPVPPRMHGKSRRGKREVESGKAGSDDKRARAPGPGAAAWGAQARGARATRRLVP